MIRLHQYPGVWGLTSLSPFCIKVEFFLRAAGLPYEVKVELNPRKGPKGKMPFIVHEGEAIPDSSFIISTLMGTYDLKSLDIPDPVEKARARAAQTMIEEGLYFILLYSRWVDPDGYAAIKKSFRGLFPAPLGDLALALIRRDLIKQSLAQGTGRHSPEEVYALGREHLRTLAVLLGTGEFFFCGRQTYFDASAFAFLVTIKDQPFKSALKEELLAQPNLCSYVERLRSVLA